MDDLTNILVEILVSIVIVMLGIIGRVLVSKLNKMQEQQMQTTVELVKINGRVGSLEQRLDKHEEDDKEHHRDLWERLNSLSS